VPAPSPATATAVGRQTAAGERTAEELNVQAARLRDRSAAVTLRPSTRNPFSFSSRKPSPRSDRPRESAVQSAPVETMIPAAPAGPSLKLSGVAQKDGKRTAILSGDGQIYLVGEGDSVAGRYSVIKVDPEAVLLRDASGAEQRLVLPQ
jgi:hypothetical protein